jgi:transcriptional regulator PpsR
MTHANVSQPDVTLLLDTEGVIREATVSNAIPEDGVAAWLGKPWVDTVVDGGNGKVNRIVEDARASGVSAFRQITQRFPSGRELPMEYTTVLLGGRAGFLAIGKSLQAVAELQSRLIAAQQTMERDYWKLREVETRYRLLFDASNEAVLLVRAGNLRIVEANPAAIRAIGLDNQRPEGLVGNELLATIPAGQRESLRDMLKLVREQGKAPGLLLHLGEQKKPWLVRASQIKSEAGPVLMMQLVPAEKQRAVREPGPTLAFEAFVDQMPDAFVVVDLEGVIKRVNAAFLDMVEIGSATSVVGERLGRWLGRPGADVPALLANLRQHGTLRLFATAIHSELGTDTEVEISAAGETSAKPSHFALLLRDVGRRLSTLGDPNHLNALLDGITSQVGKTPLRTLVKATVDGVERHYIKTALELAHGNRTAASELLGLSRQSLYVKLGRYGLEGDKALAEPSDEIDAQSSSATA